MTEFKVGRPLMDQIPPSPQHLAAVRDVAGDLAAKHLVDIDTGGQAASVITDSSVGRVGVMARVGSSTGLDRLNVVVPDIDTNRATGREDKVRIKNVVQDPQDRAKLPKPLVDPDNLTANDARRFLAGTKSIR